MTEDPRQSWVMPQRVHVTTKQKGNLGLTSPSATGLQWAEAKLPKVIGHLTNNLTLSRHWNKHWTYAVWSETGFDVFLDQSHLHYFMSVFMVPIQICCTSASGSEVHNRLQLLVILQHHCIASGTAYKGCYFMVTIIGFLCSVAWNHLNVAWTLRYHCFQLKCPKFLLSDEKIKYTQDLNKLSNHGCSSKQTHRPTLALREQLPN